MKHLHLHLHDASPRVSVNPVRPPSTVIKPAPSTPHPSKPRRSTQVKPAKPAGVIKPQTGVKVAASGVNVATKGLRAANKVLRGIGRIAEEKP